MTDFLASANNAPVIHRDVVFAELGGIELKLDLYLPAAIVAPPLVVWIHGGGWRGGSKSKPPVRRLIEDGFALASISYRFTHQAIFPAQIHDCKGAVRWLRAHQADYGYRADWIAAIGSSSGGHLAMLLGTSGGVEALEGEVAGQLEESSRVQLVVSYYGPSDFVLRGQSQPLVAYSELSGSFAMLGGRAHGRVLPELELAASPALHVTPEAPPLLAFHGTQDDLVLLDQSERIVEAYQQLGLESQLVVVPGGGHGGAVYYWGEHFQTLRNFLDTHRP